MARGDHVRVRRPQGYWHHGIDCGDDTVIHYTGELFHWRGAAVRQTPLEDFLKGGTAEIVPHDVWACLTPEEVMARAESRLGEMTYSLLRSNCEHFALWCKTGTARSPQVLRTAAATGAALLVAGGVVLTALVLGKRPSSF